MESFLLFAPVLVVAGCLWLLLRVLRKAPRLNLRLKKGAREASPALSLVGRLSLTPAHSVHLVEVGGQYLLLGAHSSGLTVIQSLAAEEGQLARAPGRADGARVRTFAGVL